MSACTMLHKTYFGWCTLMRSHNIAMHMAGGVSWPPLSRFIPIRRSVNIGRVSSLRSITFSTL